MRSQKPVDYSFIMLYFEISQPLDIIFALSQKSLKVSLLFTGEIYASGVISFSYNLDTSLQKPKTYLSIIYYFTFYSI